MGLLDSLLGAALGSGNTGNAPAAGNLASSVLSMLGSGGGFQGIQNALQSAGLGDVVKSWIGTGANLPISPGQVQQALGPMVGQLAQQHGMDAGAVSQHLSQLLPGLVDKLTPNGQVPQGGALDLAVGALRKML